MKTMQKFSVVGFVIVFLSIISMSCSNDLFDTDEDDEQQEQTYTLDDLQGAWIRVGGNNPNNEGMLIDVTDNKGKIVDPVASGFLIDDIKWNNIQAIDAENYNYQELGSDNNYYTAIMELKVDDTLRIDVIGSSGAGNIQKWVRH